MKTLIGSVVLGFLVCALPAMAAPVDPMEEALAAIFAPAPVAPPEGLATPAPQLRGVPCFANCWNGTSVSCFGYPCTGVNSNCAAGERGYCAGTSSGYKWCPACRTCTVRATCSTGSVSCTSYNNNCYKVDNCYAECDGVLHWCPQHGTCPI